MDHQSFDDILKNKLEGYEKAGPADWAQFSDKLNDALSKDPFDEAISQKMDGYQKGTPDWAAFQASRAAQEDLAFDDQLKDKVASIEKGRSDWADFSKKLQASQDAQFDKQVSESLTPHRKSYVSEHWLLLKGRLEQIAYRKQSLYRIKGLEAAFMVALLFSMFNLSHLIWETNTPKTGTSPEVVQLQNTKTTEASILASNADQKKDAGTSAASASNTEAASNKSLAASPVTLYTPRSQSPSSTAAVSSTSTNEWARASKKTSATETSSQIAQQIRHDIQGLRATAKLANVDLLGRSAMRLPLVDRDNALDAASMVLSPISNEDNSSEANPFGLAIGVEALASQHSIITPEDPTFDAKAFTHKHNDRQLGVHALLTYKSIGLNLGFTQYQYQYSPTAIVDTFGNEATKEYFIESLDQIAYMLSSLPMSVQYNQALSDTWNVYAGFGGSYNWISQSDYQIGSTDISHKEIDNPEEKSESSLVTAYVGNAVAMDDSFFRLRATTGIERYVGRSFSVFTQAAYERSFQNLQLGVSRDQINQWQIGLGFRYRPF